MQIRWNNWFVFVQNFMLEHVKHAQRVKVLYACVQFWTSDSSAIRRRHMFQLQPLFRIIRLISFTKRSWSDWMVFWIFPETFSKIRHWPLSLNIYFDRKRHCCHGRRRSGQCAGAETSCLEVLRIPDGWGIAISDGRINVRLSQRPAERHVRRWGFWWRPPAEECRLSSLYLLNFYSQVSPRSIILMSFQVSP